MTGKNIVVCSDGTGNSAIKGRGTNVFKLFEAIDLHGHRHNPEQTPQIVFYDDGVGTERFKILKIFAGATGWGLKRNVLQLYKEIARVYDPGDRIFLFGFSRGAFTVRTLVGLIHTCGIPDAARVKSASGLKTAVKKAYSLYREKYQTKLTSFFRGDPDASRVARFREENCCKADVDIAFLGVWDTVDGVGLPFALSDAVNSTIHRFKFPDSNLSECVKRACHALAIDDERHSFKPLLWNDDPRIEQVWFSGAHSNVGGGYPKQGMSLVTLDWMMTKAEENGLRFIGSDRALCREHASVDDKLYDPRAGVGVFYRWKPRDIAALYPDQKAIPSVHVSVLERIAHGTNDYAPGNLPQNANVVFTSTGVPAKDQALKERTKVLGEVLRAEHLRLEALMKRTRWTVPAGLVSYWLLLLTVVTALIAASRPAEGGTAMEYLKNFSSLLGEVATLQLGEVWTRLKQVDPLLVYLLFLGFLGSLPLAFFVAKKRETAFSEFWHHLQPRLRAALKSTRASDFDSMPTDGASPLGESIAGQHGSAAA